MSDTNLQTPQYLLNTIQDSFLILISETLIYLSIRLKYNNPNMVSKYYLSIINAIKLMKVSAD